MRFLRILINAATALSLLLALATAALWVRSYRTCDQIWTSHLVASESGAVYFASSVRHPGYPIRDSFDAGKLGVIEEEMSDHVRRLRPVRVMHQNFRWVVIVTHWFLVLTFAALPAYRLARRMRRRHPPGRCRACGYDLRATPERCPECGTIPAR